MALPSGNRFELLSPFDPRQQTGGPARVYPLHLMEPGDWFSLDQCPPQKTAAIRAAVVYFRRKHPDARFTVRYCPELGPATVICSRIA